MTEYKPDVMLYHANCADGFGAAWAAWSRWGNFIEYIPVSYGKPAPDISGKHVLIGDFSYSQETLLEMGQRAKSIIVLDHHKTAEEALRFFTYDFADVGDDLTSANALNAIGQLDDHEAKIIANFDMEKSGARIVFEFCHPKAAIPRLIELIEDRDLWRFQYEDTKPFSLWLRSEPFDFERWAIIDQDLNDSYDGHRLLSEARAMQRFFDQKVSEMASLSRMGVIDGQKVPLCNCPPMFASDVGHKLLEDHPSAPFVACYSDQGKARGYSLRSSDSRDDVSIIAQKYGGGGHRNAAGFGTPLA